MESAPENADAIIGPGMATMLAVILAQVGEDDEALALIERLLATPSAIGTHMHMYVTLFDLRFNWLWDPLRGDPRFQKIVAGPEPKTAFK